MDFIPVEFQKDYKHILEYINAYKNGVTSDTMKSYGINYKKNYGASMISLRSIAERFEVSNGLANLLWKKEWRETYILSTLIDDASVYDLQKLDNRVKQAPTLEVLEQLAYNLAWKLDFLDDFFATVAEHDSMEIHYFLIKSTTYQLMNKKIKAADAFNRISKYTFSDNVAILNVLQNLLLRITSENNDLHADVVAFCAQNQGASWEMLTEVIREYGI